MLVSVILLLHLPNLAKKQCSSSLLRQSLSCSNPPAFTILFIKFCNILVVKRRPWSEMERQAVLGHFQKAMLRKVLPGKAEIDNLIETSPCLKERTWKNVKDYIRNNMDK